LVIAVHGPAGTCRPLINEKDIVIMLRRRLIDPAAAAVATAIMAAATTTQEMTLRMYRFLPAQANVTGLIL
jgi:hypothetical protein